MNPFTVYQIPEVCSRLPFHFELPVSPKQTRWSRKKSRRKASSAPLSVVKSPTTLVNMMQLKQHTAFFEEAREKRVNELREDHKEGGVFNFRCV